MAPLLAQQSGGNGGIRQLLQFESAAACRRAGAAGVVEAIFMTQYKAMISGTRFLSDGVMRAFQKADCRAKQGGFP